MPFIVKNTFICEIDEALETDRRARAAQRSQSLGRLEGGSGSGTCGTCGNSPSPSSRSEVSSSSPRASPPSGGPAATASRGQAVAPPQAPSPPQQQLLAYPAPMVDPALYAAMPELAFSEHGTSPLLQALNTASAATLRSFALTLRGYVRAAARHVYAHVFLEYLIHQLGADDREFLLQELEGDDGAALAVDGPGSAVLCQLLAFCPGSAATGALLAGALGEGAAAMCHHKHGHKVALSVLEHGSDEQRSRIAVALCADTARTARHRFAGQVVAEALLQCSDESAWALASAIMNRQSVVSLACHCFGVHVARALLRLPSAAAHVAREIAQAQKKLAKDKFGSLLLAELGTVELAAASHSGRIGGA